MSAALFDTIKDLIAVRTGKLVSAVRLSQHEVDAINRALLGDVAKAHEGLKVSPRGVALLHSFESLRLTAYADPGSRNGLPVTNGWGATVDEDGKPIRLGAVWDKAKADRLFARDIVKFETGVNLLLGGKPCTQNQFDALVSFAYNVGLDIDADTTAEGLGDSTLFRHHLAGNYQGAQRAFAAWNKNDGKVLNGLVRRREAEAMLYGAAT